jgi:hypothetical protein
MSSYANPGMGRTINKLPFAFTENRGQVADLDHHPRPDILFTARSGDMSMFLGTHGLYYQFNHLVYPKGYDEQRISEVQDIEEATQLRRQVKLETYRVSLMLTGNVNTHPHIRREQRSSFVQHFYLQQCPQGITGVANYGRLVYESVYPNIDWVIYANGDGLKYDFVVHPGGDPSQIRLKIADARGVQITSEGELLVETSLGNIREQAPKSYIGDKIVPSAFLQHADGSIGFSVQAPANNRDLVIDPAVLWATYYGTGNSSEATFQTGNAVYGLSTDASGNVYIAGNTNAVFASGATGMATTGAFQTSNAGLNDCYLAKFDASGNLLWATYYGGSGDDTGPNCAVDPSGNVYMAAWTATVSGLATTGAYQTSITSSGTTVSPDVLLVKFNSSGVRQWATYYGGTLQESSAHCATDASGNVYLSGITASTSGIATSGSYHSSFAGGTGNDLFLVKFNSSGSRQWATYFGGTGNEINARCATDNSGNVLLCGWTASTAGAVPAGSFQSSFGGGTSDALLAKFNASGGLQWATYYGGSGIDQANHVIADGSGNVYLSGYTSSTSAISYNGFQSSSGGGNDNFLVKFSPAGARLWATYYGGSGAETGGYISTDNYNNVFLSGITGSSANIAYNGSQSSIAGGFDAYLVKFDSSGSRKWATYFGGSGNDLPLACLADQQGSIYLAGTTASGSGLATSGAYQSSYGGNTDAFLAKIADIIILTDTTITGPFCAGATINVPFTLIGSYTGFASGNVFTAQLSDASGSFASPVNIGTLNGTSAGTIIAHIPASTPAGTGYRIRVVSSAPVVIGLDNGHNITINASVTPNISISVSPDDTICAGTAVTFTAAVTNAGTAPVYQWRKNSVAVGANSSTYSSSALANGDTITAIVTSSNLCALPASDTSNSIIMTVNLPLTPTVSVAVSLGDTICAGTSVTFTATATNGGSAPAFQWLKNGTNVGANSTTYTDNNLVNGDTVTVVLSSNAACVSPASVPGNKIVMTVNPILTPVVSIAANPGNTICAGTSVTFTASAVNAGTAPVYQWKKNGVNVGTNASTYTDNSLNNGDVITLNLLSNAVCAVPASVTSNSITMTVNQVLTPAVSINANPGSTFCAGTTVTFTAIPVNGGSAPAYQWLKNGTGVGSNSPVYTDNGLVSGDVISVVMTSGATCASPLTAASNTITATVLSIPAAPTAISGTATPCQATNVSYSITPVTGATGYTWSLPSGWSGSSTAATIAAVVGTSSGNVSVTANNVCGSSVAATLPVTPILLPAIPSVISGAVNVCAGSIQTYSVVPVANMTYSWTAPSGWTGNSITNSIIYTAGSNSGAISVTATNVCGTSPGSSLTVVSNPVVTPVVSISTPDTIICAGRPAMFTAIAANGGPTPVYAWYKNGVQLSGVGNTYSDYALVSGDVINVVLTSNALCAVTNTAVSNSITMTVLPTIVPGININAFPGATSCAGTTVTFVSNIVGGGARPAYKWYRNGQLIGGASGPNYSTAALQNGDTINAVLISGETCPSVAAQPSNKVGITINPVVVPTVAVTCSPSMPVAAGTSVTFKASYTGGGATPAFQWMKNGTNIPFATGDTYTTNVLANGDIITVQMVSYDHCPQPAYVVSSGLEVTFPSTAVASVGNHGGGSFLVYPNPGSGHFTVEVNWAAEHPADERVGIDLVNALGQKVYTTEVRPGRKTWSVNIWLDEAVANGMYTLRLYTPETQFAQPLVIRR